MTPILSVTQDQTALRRVSAPGQLARQKRQTETAIRRGEFLPYLQCIVDAHSQRTLEITEDCAAWDQARAADNMARCKQLGFSIALDDLGSGHAALPNLVDFPVDIVKLDKHVLDDAACPKGRTLLLGVIQLARQLGLSVLCEGVETRQQRELVTAGGCDYIQGFLYAAPLPLDQAEIYFRAYSAGLAFS